MNLVCRGGGVGGLIRVPGDKSIAQRAAIIAALASGQTAIENFPEAGDCVNLLRALARCGIQSDWEGLGRLRIFGQGALAWQAPSEPLHLGNSGTAVRLLTGVLAGKQVDVQLTGDASLRRRPMQRILEPLARMGAFIASHNGRPPLTVKPASLHGIEWTLPVASAQLKSCLLLAGLHAQGTTRIIEPVATRDHTERLFTHFGIPYTREGNTLEVSRCDWTRITGQSVSVPADPSAAAFFAVAAALLPGSEVRLPGVCINPRRIGFLGLLARMGAEIEVTVVDGQGMEPVGDIRVRGHTLHGIDITPAEVVDALDELPVLMVAAACAEGETRLTGAQELRHKESDRIDALAACLMALGARVTTTPDGMLVTGGRLRGGTVSSAGDHRIAMAAVIAGLRCDGPVIVTGAEAIATSFPGFMDTAVQAGLVMEEAA